jgi:hypothetical protein
MKNVTKEIFLNGIICPLLGWYIRNDVYREELSAGDKFRIEQGLEIGKRARALYPDGVLVSDLNPISAAEKTKELLKGGTPVIFEGTFLKDNYVARADILRRTEEGWHLYEVKSGINDREEYIDDMTYTAMVLDRCGLDISGISLLLVSKDYRLGMPDKKLFVEIDHTDDVLTRVEEFKPYWQQVEETTRAETKPEPCLIYECRQCEMFDECLGKDVKNHIFQLPRLSQSRFGDLVESGITRIEDIPPDFSLTDNQKRVRACVVTGEIFIGENLKQSLESISFPAYYLDFETVMTAIPLYPDIAPYTQIPTQYSIHKCYSLEDDPDPKAYLASDPTKDCRRELAESLINNLGEEGSILTYSVFERAVINGLMALCPDLSEKLTALSERMVDLEAVIRKNFYHPGFHGSTSIKNVLPVLVSDMSYEGMPIADGDTAMATFAYMAMGRYEAGEAEIIKRQLLEYCGLDTMAMVKLHRRLIEYV